MTNHYSKVKGHDQPNSKVNNFPYRYPDQKDAPTNYYTTKRGEFETNACDEKMS